MIAPPVSGPAKRLVVTQTATENTMQAAIRGNPERLTSARYEPPSKVHLEFADGLCGTWSFCQLGLDMTHMKLTTIKAAVTGTSLEVKSKWNDDVEIDPSSLRATIDPGYAAKYERAFLAIRGNIDDLVVTAKRRP